MKIVKNVISTIQQNIKYNKLLFRFFFLTCDRSYFVNPTQQNL